MSLKRAISIAVSLIILAVIYWKIDFAGLIRIFKNCDGLWMAISLLMVVPLTLLTAWRLQKLAPDKAGLGAGEANRLILAASALNMVLPSKMGDIAKAYFMTERGHLDASLSLSLVIFEKGCDMVSLLLWCVFGLALYPQKDFLFWVMTAIVTGGLTTGWLLLASSRFARLFFSATRSIAPEKISVRLAKLHGSWDEMQRYFLGDKSRFFIIATMSVFIWLLHLLQIWFFILALRAWTPFFINLALSPLAILAGLLPLTFAGVGTRDAALIFFYEPFFTAPTAAALGLLCTSRYLLPAIGGLPFLGQYLAKVRSFRNQANRSQANAMKKC